MPRNKLLCDYYRCFERFDTFARDGSDSGKEDYFRFGDHTLFGTCSRRNAVRSNNPAQQAAKSAANTPSEAIDLPFDVVKAIDNLRLERYCTSTEKHPGNSLLGRAYYFARPLMPLRVRRHLQKVRLNKWRQLTFPRWPVDRTVDKVIGDLLLSSRHAHGVDRIPFIWFWPEGATSAAMVTHDVETARGRDLCSTIMDIDDAFGIKGAFSVVPEKRYGVMPTYIDSIWGRGFEVVVHDLNHDGHLYSDHATFVDRAAKINEYRKQFRAEGFRAAILYRNQEWYGALDFSYDTSVPNVGHLDPQRGGCCTVMPYFVGKVVELPVTLTQDYSLFHILNDYSIDLWKQQIELIRESHGLINVIIHPDYSTTPRERAVFEQLLSHLAKLRDEKGVWTALPKDIARWWRLRSEMRIVEDENGLRIEGQGSEMARIAYASEKDGGLMFELSSSAVEQSAPAK